MSPKITLTVFLTLLFIQTTYSQWQPHGIGLLPDTQRVASIDILNEDVVWGVSFYDRTPAPVPSDLIPHVFHTTNSGYSWDVQPIIEAKGRICQDIFVVDDSTAWITTNGLTSDSLRGLFKTTDGGKSWEEKFDNPAGGGMIHFFDEDNGIAIHEQFIAFTFDSGENWDDVSPQNSLPFDPAESVFYTAANNAIAIHGDTLWFGTTHGRVFRSTNRGFNWEAFSTPFEMENVIQSIAFQNAMEGIIISYAKLNQDAISFMDSTRVALTYDGGETWEIADTLLNFKLSCVTDVPDSHSQFLGVTNGLSTITTDSAKTWQNFSFRPYNAVDFFSSELGWVGNSQVSIDHPAIIYKWEGVVSSNKNVNTTASLDVQIFPNPFSNSFQFEMSLFDFQKYQKENISLEIFDVLGKKVLEQKITNTQTPINFPNTADGIYFYFLKTQNNFLSSGRLMKR